MNRKDKVLIFPFNGDDPETGFFLIRTKKNGKNRSLGIFNTDGLWSVYLDGKRIADPNCLWNKAFGSLYELPLLCGKKLSLPEYRALVAERTKDELSGNSSDSRINKLTTRIEI